MLFPDILPAHLEEGARKIADALKQVDKVVISGHVNVDGDSVSSLTAGGLILRALGKRYAFYSATGIPDYLAFIPEPDTVYTSLNDIPFTPQAALILDCSSANRLSGELAGALPTLAGINVDHHLGSGGLGSVANWILPDAAATVLLMAYVALACGMRLEGKLADAVALGIVSDTGGFSHGNSDVEVFRMATHLMSNGCNIPQLREKLEANWSMGQMRLWARLMRRATLFHNGSIAFCGVRLRDFRECNTTKDGLESFVEQLRRLRGVNVGALLREEKPMSCKFSLRSFGDIDVRTPAVRLKGGGHHNAAGGTIHAPFNQAKDLLLAAIAQQLDGSDSV